MKIDEEVRQKLVENLQVWQRYLTREVNVYLQKMKSAQTVEELMELKRSLLVFLIYHLPLTDTECYFCLQQPYSDCEDCLYGKVHGTCDEKGSAFAKVMKQVDKLVKAVQEHYWKGLDGKEAEAR